MKKKYLFPFSTVFLCSNLYAGQTNYHTVAKGETFSKIVEDLRFKSDYKYWDRYKILQKANQQIKNLDLIYPGQKITLPREMFKKYLGEIAKNSKKLQEDKPSKNEKIQKMLEGSEFSALYDKDIVEPEQNVEYLVKEKETLYTIVHKLYPGVNKDKLIEKILKLNPVIVDVNKIELGMVIDLPSRAFIQNLYDQRSRSVASLGLKGKKFFRKNKDLGVQIQTLTKTQSRYYHKIFNKVLNTSERKELITSLKDVLDFTRALEHDHIEQASLELLHSVIKNKENDAFLSDIEGFFTFWQKQRRAI